MKATFRLMALWVVVHAGLLALTVPAAAQTDLTPIERLREYRFSADRSALDAVAALVADAMGAPAQRRAVADALVSVATSDAAFDARQFACRQLLRVASDPHVPALVRLLHDDMMAHYALMVLDRIPGPAVGAALRAELPKLRGNALAGALDLLGERREPASVAVLADAAHGADPMTARAAVLGLAKLDLSAADAILMREHPRTKGELHRAVCDALALRAQALLSEGKRQEAARMASLLNRQGEPAPVRAAGLRIGSPAMGPGAVPGLIAALQSPERVIAHTAAAAIRDLPGAAVTRMLCASLPRLNAASRALLLDALADRGDPTAASAVARLLKDPEGAVRLRAIAALGTLGGAQSVLPLLGVAATGTPAERTAALDAVGRLRGAGVDARVLSALDDASGAVRAAALRTAYERGADVPLDRVLRMAVADTGEAQGAALDALRTVGTAVQLPALLSLFVKTAESERDPVLGAIASIARRDSGGVGAVVRSLQQASRPADRTALLACLGEIGGPEALRALMAASADADTEVQITALRALAEWPTAEPKELLLATARNPANARARAVALRGYIRMLRLPGGPTLADAPRLYREALELAQSADEKRQVLSGLATVGSPQALAMAHTLAADADLRPEAEQAALSIAHMTAGAWPAETRDALQRLIGSALDEGIRGKAAKLLATMDRFADFVLAWEVSPAYEREGLNFSALFDVAFSPESGASDADVGWHAMPVGTEPEQPWLVDLLALYGGEQKVAYLRTAVWSDAERELVAEFGTDDGLKIWWNGEMMLANNTQRAVAPGQEKVRLKVRAGWNAMMVKVTQNIMGWGACARFTATDGGPAIGLRFALPSFVKEPAP
jgi:HEAT repeat protein